MYTGLIISVVVILITVAALLYTASSSQICTGVAGDDIRQKLEFHHTHLELGALGYIETFLFYWSWGF